MRQNIGSGGRWKRHLIASGVAFFVILLSNPWSAGARTCADLFGGSVSPFVNEIGDKAQRMSYLNTDVLPEQARSGELQYGSLAFGSSFAEIVNYSKSGSITLYRAMVKKPALSAEEVSRTAALEGELRLLPAFIGTTWSGMLAPRDWFRSAYRESTTVTPEYFLSSSRDRLVAERFSTSGESQEKSSASHVRVIHEIQGRSGRDIESLSAIKGEQEVLFPPFTKFRVDAILNLGKDKKGFETYLVRMSERLSQVPRLSPQNRLDPVPSLDVRRLMTKQEYDSLLARQQISGYMNLNETQNWMATWQWLIENSSRLRASESLLQEIHKRVMKDVFMLGYERRRVRSAFQNRLITESEALKALDGVEKRIAYSSTPHETLKGRYREDLDILIDRTNESWPLSVANLRGASLNPLLRIDMETVRPLSPGYVAADIHLAAPKDIPRLMRESFERFERLTSRPLSSQDYVRAVTELEIHLIAIHPFLDGNGRSIRLLRDLLLFQRDIPPPLFVTENDFYKPLEIQWRERVEEIQAYQRERSLFLLRRQKNSADDQ